MTGPKDETLTATLLELAGVLLSEDNLDTILNHVTTLALRTVPSAAAVSVSLLRRGEFVTAASSHGSATEVDRAQYESKAGPCVAATEEGEAVYVATLDDAKGWDTYRKAAEANGFACTLSLPLKTPLGTQGALNLYATSPGRFVEREREVGMLFAKQASVLVANATSFSSSVELASNLRAAMESREVIAEAKGILMERYKISSSEAFAKLRTESQTKNIKLREIAASIVDSAGAADTT